MANTTTKVNKEDDNWETVAAIKPQTEEVIIDEKIQLEALLAEQVQLAAFWKNRALIFQQKLFEFQKKLSDRQNGKVN